ncbi:MAG: hypothetical protein SWX82_09260 [Cyanobacteriota bacterium]|nr:hypothetical protein [Cyanobacteriota bacterium]
MPEFIKDDFSNFYQSLFQKEYERSGKNAAFLEYAGLLPTLRNQKCDPRPVVLGKIFELQEIFILKVVWKSLFW